MKSEQATQVVSLLACERPKRLDVVDVVDLDVDGRDADGLIAELDRMRPVYEAAMAYQWQYDRWEYGDGEDDMRSHGALLEACRACERLDRVDVVDAGVDGRTA